MYCTNCGAAVVERDSFCSQCGTAIGAVPTARPIPRGRRLTRSIYDNKIAGVCGGLAAYLDVDPTLMRVIWRVCSICFPPLALGYIAAWIIVPKEAPQLEPIVPGSVPHPQV